MCLGQIDWLKSQILGTMPVLLLSIHKTKRLGVKRLCYSLWLDAINLQLPLLRVGARRALHFTTSLGVDLKGSRDQGWSVGISCAQHGAGAMSKALGLGP
jgi:hypothetical protein